MLVIVVLVALFIAGNMWANHERDTRTVPHWDDAPPAEKVARLFWPTALLAYRRYPKWGRHGKYR